MRRFLVLLLLFTTATQAATTINVGDTVMVSGVKRFGLNLNYHYYYDRVILKNLVWRNAGFEGLLFRSMIRCESGTPTGCVDANYFVQWPSGFWNDGSYEFVLGTAKGRSGSIASSTAPPGGNGTGGTTFVFNDSGMTPAAGDYFIARKYFPGGAEVAWNIATNGGATVTTETMDLPPATNGRQCIRLSAAAPGQFASIGSPFGFFAGATFVLMNGSYRITFKAKAVGGSNTVNVSVLRGPTQLTNQAVALSTSWSDYTVDFSASEPATATGVRQLAVSGGGLLGTSR